LIGKGTIENYAKRYLNRRPFSRLRTK
jgi:hypothetical protein